jgi:hypothetical protein
VTALIAFTALGNSQVAEALIAVSLNTPPIR